MQLKEFITKALLENAIKYEGKTKAQAALGAVMREFPEYRGKTQEVLPIAEEIAQEINELEVSEQQERLDNMGGSDAPEKEEKDPFELPSNAKLRFEPSPSGPLHIGHAFSLGLNHLLAARNDAQLTLRIADTNPDNIYPQAYKLIEADAQWYTHQAIHQVIIQSERLELYYLQAEKLLAEGHAYICTCSADEFREHSKEQTACPCRELAAAKNLERFEQMKTVYEPGDAVMRIKTDMKHKNPAMRDWPAMRVSTSKHPRQENKYRAWPLMNFAVAIDDIELGMTHVLRAKDHQDNAKRQEWIYNYLDEPIPETQFVGKINFTDLKLSTSKTRLLIEQGEYTGWDDIRLPFLQALRRRGYQPEAFLRLAQEVGISSTDKTLSKDEYFQAINAYNKQYIEQTAHRAFFIKNPVEITIQEAPTTHVSKPKHPSDKKQGTREFEVGGDVIVQEEDLKEPEGILFRLVDAYNFRYEEGQWIYVSESYEDFKAAKKKRIIHYLPAQESAVNARIHYPDGSYVHGILERGARDYEEGTILQFERIGYVRLDDEETQTYWYAHD